MTQHISIPNYQEVRIGRALDREWRPEEPLPQILKDRLEVDEWFGDEWLTDNELKVRRATSKATSMLDTEAVSDSEAGTFEFDQLKEMELEATAFQRRAQANELKHDRARLRRWDYGRLYRGVQFDGADSTMAEPPRVSLDPRERLEDARRYDDAPDVLPWLRRCDVAGPVNERCGDREFLSYQLGQARVELEELLEDAMRKTGASRREALKFKQIEAAIGRGVALREAYNYRRRCAALGWSTYKRIAFKRRYRTYERANRELARLIRARNHREFHFTGGQPVMVDGLVPTRIRRKYALGAGGTHLRQAA